MTETMRPPRAAADKGIRIKQIMFSMPNGRDVPLAGCYGGMTRITAGRPPDSNLEIDITYEPWQRHHRVIEWRHAGATRTKTSEFCVHESWCLYVPWNDDLHDVPPAK